VTDGTNLTTAAGLEALEAELAVLEGDGRREIAERIKTAREWGDLKENSEYHDAKNDQAHLETKIARLREKITASSRHGASSAPTTPPRARGACRRNRPSPSRSSGARPAIRPRSRCPRANAR